MKIFSALPLFLLVANTAYAQHQGSIYTRLNVNAQSSDEGEGSFSEIKSNHTNCTKHLTIQRELKAFQTRL